MGSSTFNDLTGGLTGETSGERAARRAAGDLQAGAARAEATTREFTQPYRDLGSEAAKLMMGNVYGVGQAPSAVTAQQVLNDPFYRAMNGQQNRSLMAQLAAGGRAGSGGGQDAMARQMLLLGDQFRNSATERNQLTFQNKLAENQQRFGQLFGITGLGANAAVGAGTQIGDYQTGAASAKASGRIGAANAKNQAMNDLFSRGTALATGGMSEIFKMPGGGGGYQTDPALGGFNPDPGF
jgi:hypothetical protein